MTAPCTYITDSRLVDLLGEIFVRLPTALDLVHASITFHHVDSIRHLVTDRSFLRRFRKEHSHIFIGFFYRQGFHPPPPPHTSTPMADAVARTADFSFSFLPRPTCYRFFPTNPSSWSIKNIRDGRVLLDRGFNPAYCSLIFLDIVVCDPLHRRYHQLPTIPNDLDAMVKDLLKITQYCCYEVVLLPPGNEVGEENEEYETSFRVIWMAQCMTKAVAFIYHSITGRWEAIASKSWSDLLGCAPTVSLKSSLFGRCHYAHGCLYWPMLGIEHGLKDYPWEVLLVLDTMRMEFSVAGLPPGRSWRGREIAIVEADEGRLGLINISNVRSQLRFTVRQNTCGNSDEWLLEKIIPLDTGFGYQMVAANERYLLLWKFNSSLKYNEGFLLDVKTFQLTRVGEIHNNEPRFIYTSFPPSFSSTTI